MHNWFPLGIAKDRAFCNRTEEKKRLKYNALHGVHTLIISPRRYGKTSLARQVMNQLKFPACIMEFTLAADQVAAQNIISTGIGHLIISLMPSHKKAFALAAKYFSKLHPNLIIDSQLGARIELKLDADGSQANITTLLESLDQAAGEAKKRVILLMDEFQQIAILDGHQLLEAAIRNAAQSLENVSIIFSGSNRHLLQLMFDDQSRPLYHLCDRIELSRVDEKHYIDYIEHAAVDRWRTKIALNVIEKILYLTQRHSYYVNVLCARLWRLSDSPTEKIVENSWDEYIGEEGFRIANELSKLSQHQKMMLMVLAINPFMQPTSKEVVARMRVSVGSAAKSCKLLLENDHIYKAADGYFKILDPAMESYLKKEARSALGL